MTTHEPIAVTPAGADRLAVAGTPADCVRLRPAPPRPRRLLGPGRDQRGGEPGDRRLPLGDRGGGPRGRAQRPAGDRACRTTWPAAGRSTGRSPPAAPRRSSASSSTIPWEPGYVLERQPPAPRARRPEPAIVFCPLDPSPLPLSYRRRGTTRRSTAATINNGPASPRAMSMSASAARSR